MLVSASVSTFLFYLFKKLNFWLTSVLHNGGLCYCWPMSKCNSGLGSLFSEVLVMENAGWFSLLDFLQLHPNSPSTPNQYGNSWSVTRAYFLFETMTIVLTRTGVCWAHYPLSCFQLLPVHSLCSSCCKLYKIPPLCMSSPCLNSSMAPYFSSE
jgi:hypothetical protein